MGIIIPTNVARNIESTANKKPWIDVGEDATIRFRFLPAVEGSNGEIWYHTHNHFRLKNEDGDRGIAVACNEVHGDGKCLLCEVVKFLQNSDDKNERHLAKSKESIRANGSWYAQGFIATKTGENEDGSFIYEYGDVKLLRLPKTGAQAVSGLMVTQQRVGEKLFNDPMRGKDVAVTRQDTGMPRATYSAMLAGESSKLDEIKPGWKDQIRSYEDIWKTLALRIMSNEEQIVVLKRSYPEFDWGRILKEIGY